MKRILVLFMTCTACIRPPSLPTSSQYNVIGVLNDSTWFATGKAIRLVKPKEQPNSVKQFNLQMITDINYPGNGSATRSPIITGCLGECIPTQRLHVYNIPLKKGKFKLRKLDKARTVDLERINYWLLINGGGMNKNYHYEGRKPGWIRITRYDPQSNTVEGAFSFDLDENLKVYNRLINSMPLIARFRQGLFRVKIEDIKLKQ
ncbi:hypothetical protein [Spirosoma flavum]|uniref:Uncharacterized protein n=1 Tax=Spirosoma flavum TaxID=2048557 RepID=A0ABW6AME4_9BACT